jgi:addiction module RelE/StbE family toxin
MNFRTHRKFDKAFRKVPRKIKDKFYERAQIFLQDEYDPQLRNHALSGKYAGSRSIDITGDWRVVYELVADDEAMFMDIGTHSQLYG